MTIIRDGKVQTRVFLSEEGEITTAEHESSAITKLLEEEYKKGFQAGLKTGIKQGHDKAEDELNSFSNLLQKIVEKLLEERNALYEKLKPDLVSFCLAVSERLIRSELSDPEATTKLISSLLALLPADQEEMIKITLSKDDLQTISGYLEEREIKGIRFIADNWMQRGDVKIETKSGLLHYSISREIENLREKILK